LTHSNAGVRLVFKKYPPMQPSQTVTDVEQDPQLANPVLQAVQVFAVASNLKLAAHDAQVDVLVTGHVAQFAVHAVQVLAVVSK